MEKKYEVQTEWIIPYHAMISGVFKYLEPKIRVDVDRCKYPYSASIMYTTIKKIDILLASFLNLEIPFAFYTSEVLIRVIVEHFLVNYFILAKCLNDYSDKTGYQYFSEYYSSEYIKRKYYQLSVEHGKKKSSAKLESLKEFNKMHKIEYLQKDVDKIHEVAAQFADIRKIYRYLISVQHKIEQFNTFHQNLDSMLHTFNLASSYVHGGPGADNETFYLFSDEAKLKMYQTFKDFAYASSFILKEQLLLMVSETNSEYNNAFIPIRKTVEHLVKEVNS